jgi:hypothetical protein
VCFFGVFFLLLLVFGDDGWLCIDIDLLLWETRTRRWSRESRMAEKNSSLVCTSKYTSEISHCASGPPQGGGVH